MAANIGSKIELDGEAQYKQALKEITAQCKSLSSELKLTTAQFATNAKSEEALKAKTEALTKQIEAQTKRTDLLKQNYEKLSKELGENDAETQKAKKAYLDSATALQKMDNELQATKDELANLGKESKDTSEKMEKLKAGFETAGKVAAGAMAAAGAAVAALAAGVAKVTTALVDFTKEGAEYADNVKTMADQTGLTTDKIQELQYASELVDVDLETMTGSMAKNIKSMTSAANGSKNTADAYKRLGVSVKDSNGNLRDSQDVYWELIDALGNVENETERDSLAMTLLGRNAQSLNPLIKKGGTELKKLAKEAHDVGYVMGGDALNAFGDFDDQMQRLKATTTGLKNNLGMLLLPMLSEITGSMNTLLGDLSKNLQEADGDMEKSMAAIETFIDGAAAEIERYAPTVIEGLTSLFSNIGRIIVESLPKLIEAAGRILSSMLSGLTNPENMKKIADAAVGVITTLCQALINPENVQSLVNGAIEILTGLCDFLLDEKNIQTLVDTAVMMIQTLAEGLGKALPQLVPKAVEAIVTLVDSLIQHLPDLIAAGNDIILGLVKGVGDAIPLLLKKAPDIIVDFVSALIEALPELITGGIEITFALIEGLIKALPELLAMPKTICEKFAGKISEWIGIPTQSGEEMADAVSDGISTEWDSNVDTTAQNMTTKLKMGLTGLVGQLEDAGVQLSKGMIRGLSQTLELYMATHNDMDKFTEAVKRRFGIASPSKVFAKIGTYMAEGLEQGFTGEMQKASKAMISSVPSDFSLFTGRATGSRSLTLNNYNTFNSATERDGAAFLRSINRQLGTVYGGI